jgi:hypothetical protein
MHIFIQPGCSSADDDCSTLWHHDESEGDDYMYNTCPTPAPTACDGEMYSVFMSDSWGDGWGTSTLRIYDCLGELLKVCVIRSAATSAVFSMTSSVRLSLRVRSCVKWCLTITLPLCLAFSTRVTSRLKMATTARKKFAWRKEPPLFRLNAEAAATSNMRYFQRFEKAVHCYW